MSPKQAKFNTLLSVLLLILFASLVILQFDVDPTLYVPRIPVPLSVCNPVNQTVNQTKQPVVKILAWTFTSNPPFTTTMGRLRRLMESMNKDDGAECRNFLGADTEFRCEFSLEPDMMPEADAVAFYMFNSGYRKVNLPQIRKPNQLWVSFVQEAPPHSLWVDPLNNLFNWTMSYRMDSELWAPYGRTISLDMPVDTISFENVTLDKWIEGKTKLISGVISHCQTPAGRQELIQKMNKTERVEIFGGCGDRSRHICDLESNYNLNCNKFWHEFSSEYKFFVAFENALCKDYITEKFWRTLEFGMVPVVYGGGSYAIEAPPNSYVDARNFTSTGELMRFLRKVGDDKEEYAKYFEWKKTYRVEQKWSRSFCNLCKAVYEHKIGTERINKVYGDLKHWWLHQPYSEDSACDKPPVYDD